MSLVVSLILGCPIKQPINGLTTTLDIAIFEHMFNFLKPKPKKEKSLGQVGEEYAQQEYKKRGWNIIAANEFNRKGKRLGEIDFIGKNKEKIVFVEVKSRTDQSEKYGSGVEAVDIYKQRKILAAVKMYLLRNEEYQSLIPQIDVCVVRFNGVDKHPYSATILANAVEDWN